MNVLLRANVHTNELTSGIVARSHQAAPIDGVTLLWANEIGSPADRFVDCDIDLVDNDPGLINRDPLYPYPDDPIADPGSHMYEARIAPEQWRIANNYDLTVAIHDSPSFPERYDGSSFATISTRTHPSVLRGVSYLGIHDVIVDDFGFAKNCPRGLTVDICSPSPAWEGYGAYAESQIAYWRRMLGGLAAATSLMTLPPAHDLSFYKFFRAFSWNEAKALRLTDISVEQPYTPMPSRIADFLQTDLPLVALGLNWNGRNASNGALFGAVAVRLTDFAYDPALQ